MSDEKMAVPLVAGRELDALVAEITGEIAWDYVIEGCSRNGRRFPTREAAEESRAKSKYFTGPIVLHDDVPDYSTEIAPAMDVLGRFAFGITKVNEEEMYVVDIWSADGKTYLCDGISESLPHAICLAFLKAISVSPLSEPPLFASRWNTGVDDR